VVVTRGDDVGLDPAALVCDVWAFEEAGERAELEQAASYIGPRYSRDSS
jgi:hypothetical protein